MRICSFDILLYCNSEYLDINPEPNSVLFFMSTSKPNDQTANASSRGLTLIDFLPELDWRPVMPGNQKREFDEWWYETIFPELAALGRLIVRL